MLTHERAVFSFQCSGKAPFFLVIFYSFLGGKVALTITDTCQGKLSWTADIEAVLRKIEYWRRGLIAKFKITCRDETQVPQLYPSEQPTVDGIAGFGGF